MASGFGTRNGTIEDTSDVLQYVWLEAFTPKQCNESLMRNLNYPDQSLDSKTSIKNLLKANNFICTWSPRKDVCKGDSGGRSTDNGIGTQEGLSFGWDFK